MLPGARLAPAARFRIWQFVEPLRALGHAVEVRVLWPERYWAPPTRVPLLRRMLGYGAGLLRLVSALWITRDVERFDIVFMNRDLVPEAGVTFLEPWLARRNPHLVFDVDDAIHLGSREKKLRKILPEFALVAAGNEYLADFARQVNARVEVWPTVVDTERFRPVDSRTPGPPRIGWSGSASTLQHCLPILERVMVELARTENFELLIVADRAPDFAWPGVTMRYLPWSPENEVESLQLFDIGLMPLKDDPFERGKCGAKALTYMAIGIPALVSPVGVNSGIVTPGNEGYHCRSDDEWLAALRNLLHDPTLRAGMGHNAVARVEAEYSLHSLVPRMVAAFTAVAGVRS